MIALVTATGCGADAIRRHLLHRPVRPRRAAPVVPVLPVSASSASAASVAGQPVSTPRRQTRPAEAKPLARTARGQSGSDNQHNICASWVTMPSSPVREVVETPQPTSPSASSTPSGTSTATTSARLRNRSAPRPPGRDQRRHRLPGVDGLGFKGAQPARHHRWFRDPGRRQRRGRIRAGSSAAQYLACYVSSSGITRIDGDRVHLLSTGIVNADDRAGWSSNTRSSDDRQRFGHPRSLAANPTGTATPAPSTRVSRRTTGCSARPASQPPSRVFSASSTPTARRETTSR